jgi:hypothetical protein
MGCSVFAVSQWKLYPGESIKRAKGKEFPTPLPIVGSGLEGAGLAALARFASTLVNVRFPACLC